MTAIHDQLDLRQIDRSDWKTYRFSQIARSISERVEPQQTDLATYVGLEHIDAESIHIKRFGKPSDVEGTKLRVYPGDVIFGKRRAYQRKAAIATFNGICSAHAMVLRANPAVIEPRLFPFFLHSDLFMHRAIDISVGSLSPTINWGTLKDQEFLLPPLDQQAKLTELLWAADEVVERYGELEKATRKAKDSLLNEILHASKTHSYAWKAIREVADVVGGYAFKSESFKSNNTPMSVQVLKIANLTQGGLALNKTPTYLNDCGVDRKFRFCKNDIVISLTGSNGKRDFGFAVLNESNEGYWVNQRLAIIRSKSDLARPMFLYTIMKENLFLDKFFNSAVGTANQANVSIKDLGNIVLPFPNIDIQDEISSKVNQLTKLDEEVKNAKSNVSFLLSQLINQLFCPEPVVVAEGEGVEMNEHTILN